MADFMNDVNRYLSGTINKSQFIAIFSKRCSMEQFCYDIHDVEGFLVSSKGLSPFYPDNRLLVEAFDEIAYSRTAKTDKDPEIAGKSSFVKGSYIRDKDPVYVAILALQCISDSEQGVKAICNFYKERGIEIDESCTGEYFSYNLNNDVNVARNTFEARKHKKRKQRTSSMTYSADACNKKRGGKE